MCLCGDTRTGTIQASYEGQPDRYRDLSHDTELLTCFLISPTEHRPHSLTPSASGFLLSAFHSHIKAGPRQLLSTAQRLSESSLILFMDT